MTHGNFNFKSDTYSCLVALESCQKQVETDKKAVDELIRERDNLNKVHQTIIKQER